MTEHNATQDHAAKPLDPDRRYCAKFIEDAAPGSICDITTDGHTCGRPVGHEGYCECDCGVKE